MEKGTPHYGLSAMQAKIAACGINAFTVTALHGGWDMGLTSDDMLAVIAGLRRADFYKSMTTIRDHTVW
jgi:motility quorum-sensing regulator/GCU-specific mRNA interferase toxin